MAGMESRKNGAIKMKIEIPKKIMSKIIGGFVGLIAAAVLMFMNFQRYDFNMNIIIAALCIGCSYIFISSVSQITIKYTEATKCRKTKNI